MSKIRSPSSLRGHLLLWFLGPLLIVGMLAIYDSYHSARATADSVSDRVLSGSALAIAERVFVNDDNALEVDIPYVALQMLTSLEDDRVFYRIEGADGSFITGYRDLKLPTEGPALGDVAFVDGMFRGEPIRIATYSSAASSSTKSFEFRVGIAETTNARKAIAQSILVRSLVRQTLTLVGAALLVWLAVGQALRPLQRLEAAVARRSPDDVRPIQHKVPDEVSGLVHTINGLVERFAASISALQNFTSSASHQFRTPLALIKTHLEVATRELDPARQNESIGQASAAVDDAERLMSQMLLLARIDAASTEEIRKETCDLTAVAHGVCEEFVLQLSHEGRLDVDLGFKGDEQVTVYADQTLAQEAVRNLVDNAIKHSGDNPKVDVLVERIGSMGTVSVRDQGAGFRAEIQLEERASQRSPTKGALQDNAGLGLSIVKEITDLLDGDVTAESSGQPPGMNVKLLFRISL